MPDCLLETQVEKLLFDEDVEHSVLFRPNFKPVFRVGVEQADIPLSHCQAGEFSP